MARMIPTQIDEGTVSNAERRVFALLQKDSGTKDWTVFHSLNLSHRPSGPYGEIDFVAVIPTEGIVCLEVKGGRVSCQNGVWLTKNRYGKIARLKRSPFQQAREGMFALRDKITKHFGRNSAQSCFPIGCATVFHDVACPPITPEFERVDVIDTEDLKGPISKPILHLAEHRLRQLSEKWKRFPDQSEVEAINTYLRPDFDQVVAKSKRIARSEESLLRLTEEQYLRLDELEANPRCFFAGAAGTGKTMLAVEFARRAALAGDKVIFICFNHLLGEQLRTQTEGLGVNTGTWHGIAKKLILASSVRSDFQKAEAEANDGGDPERFYKKLYPLYFKFALEELEYQFDVLVLDEAQDLCRPEILETLNLALRGGLGKGRWAMFGDFVRQALYDETEDPVKILSHHSKFFVRSKLTLNCRNTRKIAEETTLLAGFDEPPFGFGREEGLPVEHRYWNTNEELEISLSDTLAHLVEDDIPVEDIVFLSPRRLKNSCLSKIEQISGFPVVDSSLRANRSKRHCIKFSTIHAFKGLESKVVIVVDVEKAAESNWQSLMYVAMSRARSLLFMFVKAGFRGKFESRLKTGQK